MNNNKTTCPICGRPNNCAIENGKDISKCWCTKIKLNKKIDIKKYDSCICEECFKRLNKNVDVK